jgi:signal transduction histidine kinase
MNITTPEATERERELGAIIAAYNDVTEQLKRAHERLGEEVSHLRNELARKNAELRRRERLAALGEMAAGVAHEIRNPLSGIRLFASLLGRDLQNQPAELRMVTKISKCVGSLEEIVSDILHFGRPTTPNPSSVGLGPVVREAVELASSRTRDSEIRFEVGAEVDEIELVTDAALLQRAVTNLLVNAAEATTPDRGRSGEGRVCVRADRNTTDRIAVQIEDNGPGIPSELMDRIFNPFFTTKDKGTGLGLAIVHQIAETLGGSVRAANRAGGGAVFTLLIPVRHEETFGDTADGSFSQSREEVV